MSAVLRLECMLVEELAHSERAHLRLVPLNGEFMSTDDTLVSSCGKLTVDVLDSNPSITFERGRFYRAEITIED